MKTLRGKTLNNSIRKLLILTSLLSSFLITACNESKQLSAQLTDPSKFYLILPTTAEIVLTSREERVGRLVSIDYASDKIEYFSGNQAFNISISDVDRIVFDQTELPMPESSDVVIRGEEQEWVIEPPNSFEIRDPTNGIAVVPKADVTTKNRNTVTFTSMYRVNELVLSSKGEILATVLGLQNDE